MTSSYLAGGLTLQTQALKSITTAATGTMARSYSVTYQASAYSGRLQVTSIQECAKSASTCHPATQFSPTDNALNTAANFPIKSLQGLGSAATSTSDAFPYNFNVIGDLDGDGTREAIIVTINKSNRRSTTRFVRMVTLTYYSKEGCSNYSSPLPPLPSNTIEIGSEDASSMRLMVISTVYLCALSS